LRHEREVAARLKAGQLSSLRLPARITWFESP
jgi:hypothetical protein